MLKKGIFATLVAKPGKESEVEDFLRKAKILVKDEPGTMTWYAVKVGPLHYAIFDTFKNDSGRQTHLHGKIAQALVENAPELFSETPVIDICDIIAYT